MMTEQKILTRYGYILAVRHSRRRLRIWAWVLALMSLAAGVTAVVLTWK
jgi:hypothetical protein